MAKKEWVDITAEALYGTYDAYIRYANQVFNITSKTEYPSENGLRAYRIKENTCYRVEIMMQSRFRLACTSNVNTGQTVTNYVFDPLDRNESENIGARRELEITSEAGQTYLLVGAWTNIGNVGSSCADTLASIVVYEERENLNPVVSITVTAPPDKTEYLTGEKLDVAGLIVTAAFEDGTSEAVLGYTLSGYDADTAGVQKITVSYENFTTEFSVTVHGVKGLSITNPPVKTDYITGDSLDTTGLVVSAAYDNEVTMEVTGYVISGFDTNGSGQEMITASYYGQMAGFTVTVHKATGIGITPPEKLDYAFGEKLDTAGLMVTVICEDGYSLAVTEYAVSGYSPTTVGQQTITVSYRTFTASFRVTVESTITGIEITALPDKVSYKQGEEFDSTGLVVSAVMQDGSKVAVTDYTLSGFDGSVLGQQTIMAEYQEKTAVFTVTVVQNLLTAACGTPTLANVTASLDLYTGVLTLQGTGAIKAFSSSASLFYNSKSKIKEVVVGEGITVIGSYMCYGCSKLEKVTLPTTVTGISTYAFYGCSVLSEVVNTEHITSIASYGFYNCYALTGMNFGSGITSIYSNSFSGCSKITAIHLDVEYESISGFPWGATKAVVTWGTYPLASLELLTPPDKTEYRYGESFVSAGTTVRVYYTDGAGRDITKVSDLSFGGYSSVKLGEQTVTVTYRTVSASIQVTVTNYATGIRVEKLPDKTSYEAGEQQDNTGLVVSLVYADGSATALTDYTVSDIDYEIYGMQDITVTYGEYTVEYQITGNFPTRLAKLMGVTSNMELIRNSKNDDGTDNFKGVDWFLFNGIAAERVYISGNNWLGLGVSSEQLKVCRRDGATWVIRRIEHVLSNGHRFLKFEIEGYTYYSSTSSTYRLVYEVYLFDDNSMFLNIITTPTSSSYMGTSCLVCNGVTTNFSVAANTPDMYSFYPTDESATAWTVEQAPHKYLLTGIEITVPPDKTGYRCGEELDLTGMEVVLRAELGKDTTVTDYAVSGYEPLSAGIQTITISYRGYQTSLEVTVTDGFTVRFMYYDANTNQAVVLKKETVNYGQDATPPEDTSNPGYIFLGWATSFQHITWDTDVYADYLPKNVCTVLFLDYDGRLLKKQFVARGGSAVPPDAPAREGYVFSGWDKSYGYVVTDLSVMAVYEERSDKFTVTFLDWDGNPLKSEQVGYGGSAAAPVPPERKGYFFLAWSSSYEYVTSDITTQAVYRSNRLRTSVEFYNGNSKAGELRMAIDCYIEQRLNGECTMELTTLASYAEFVQKRFRMEFDGLIFDLTGIEKKTQGGTYLTTLKGEHVSYILNDEEYDIEEFSFTGKPKKCLAKILQGTPFSVGKVDFTEEITLKVNQKATRRDVLMQLIALCGGEIEYEDYRIGIREHIGNMVPVELMDTENVTNVGMSYNAAEHTETYSIELSRQVGVSLGDEIHIVFTPLSINKTKRITGLKWNPFNYRKISVSVGGYRACISDSLYQVTDDTDSLQEQIDGLSSNMNSLSDALDSMGNSMGGFNVMSVSELPANPDMNTIYLIQGMVEVN